MERKNSKQEEKVSLVDNKNGKEQISLKGRSEKPCAFGWHFVSLKTWTVSYQINSLVVFDVMKTRYLLASQPGGTYVILMSSALNQQEAPEEKVMENCFFFFFYYDSTELPRHISVEISFKPSPFINFPNIN